MTRDEVLRIAREVYGQDTRWQGVTLMRLEALARKFRQAERQACIEAVRNAGVKHPSQDIRDACANAIAGREIE